MLSRLMRALSFEDPSVRPFCEYFNMLQGEGGGKPRVWDWSVYSGETQAALLQAWEIPTALTSGRGSPGNDRGGRLTVGQRLFTFTR